MMVEEHFYGRHKTEQQRRTDRQTELGWQGGIGGDYAACSMGERDFDVAQH